MTQEEEIIKALKTRPLTRENKWMLAEMAIEASIKFAGRPEGAAAAYQEALPLVTYFFVVKSAQYFKSLGCDDEEEDEPHHLVKDLCDEV